MNKFWPPVFMVFLSISTNFYAIDIALYKSIFKKQKAKTIVYIDICFGGSPSDAIIKDSMKISVDTPALVVQEWGIKGEQNKPVEEYVVPLKLRKKVYKNSFRIKIVAQGHVPERGCNFYFSCFVAEKTQSCVEDERLFCFCKKIFIQKQKNTKKSAFKPLEAITSRGVFLGAKKLYCDRPIWLVNAKYLFFLLMGLIFVGFLIVDVLSLFDVVSFLGLGAWGYFAHFVVPHFFVLLICAIWLLMLAVWYLVKESRMVLGLLCASSVLPLLVQAYVSFCFG